MLVGQLGSLVLPGAKGHTAIAQPTPDGRGFLFADRRHLGVERALGKPLLVDPDAIEQVIVNYGVVHAHAPLVEYAQDGLVGEELVGDGNAKLELGARIRQGRQRAHVGRVVNDLARFRPLLYPVTEPLVGEVRAPDGRVFPSHLGH